MSILYLQFIIILVSADAHRMRLRRSLETPQESEDRRAKNRERDSLRREIQHPKQSFQRKNRVTTAVQSLRSIAVFTVDQPHRLGPMNVQCRALGGAGCGALHWAEEAPRGKCGTFNDCCRHGKIQLPKIPEPTPILSQLFKVCFV